MPLLPLSNDPRRFAPNAPEIDVSPLADPYGDGEDPSAGDIAMSALRQENIVGSLIASRDLSRQERFQQEPNFDPFSMLAGTEYEGMEDRFTDVFNTSAFEARKRQLDMEMEDRRTLDSAGIWGDLAVFGSAIADPTIALPGGALVKGVRGGYAVGRTAASTALAAGGAATVSELGLQATQQLRTPEESAFVIGGSIVLGSLIGGGAAAFLTKAERRTLAKSLDDMATSRAPDEQVANENIVAGLFSEAGAAATQRASLEDFTIAGKAAGAVGKASAWAKLNPLVRLLESPSVEARQLATSLMENPVYLRQNLEGVASEAAVETLVKEYAQGAVSDVLQTMKAEYKAYRKTGGELTYPEFRQAVGMAMREADRSDIEQIARVAEAWRKRIFDPLKERAIAEGLLPKDVKVATAESYLSRLWNWRKIEANEGRFKSIVRKWIDEQISDVEGSKKEFVSKADRDGYIEEIVDEVYNRITGRQEGDLPRDIVPTKRGPLKERTFNIPDKRVEEFIESDIDLVGRRYARIMAAEVELTRKTGSPDMKEALKRITDQYAALRKKVEAAGDKGKVKELERLNAKEKADIRDLKAVRDMLRGTYLAKENQTFGARALAVANTLNYLRAMGGVVVSSMADVARPMMVHGLRRYMADGVVPLVRNLKAVKMSVKEARLAGAVAERILNTRMATWAEIADPYSVSSPFERFLENTATGFSHLNGMVYWNDFMKSFSSVMTQNRLLEGVERFAKIGQKEKAYLAFLGIDESMASRIAKQFAEHGMVEDGIRVASTENWTDAVARRAYRAAINKDVDSIIVTKGIGDTPLFARTPVGRAMLQFKSFALASHQRAFMRGLQGAELGVDGGASGALAAMMTATAIGSMIYYLKAVESNRDISDNPGRFIAEGLDRSGLFAVSFEVNNTMEKAFGIGAYGALQALFPDKEQSGKASRYAIRSTAAAMTGPTGDFVDTMVRVVNGLKRGDLKESDVNAIRRLAPGGTLPGVRSVLEYQVIPKAKEAVR